MFHFQLWGGAHVGLEYSVLVLAVAIFLLFSSSHCKSENYHVFLLIEIGGGSTVGI